MGKYSGNKKRNIAFLLPSMYGGGAERVASELSQFMEKEGHNVYIFTERARRGYSFAGKIVLLKPSVVSTVFPKEIMELVTLSKEIKKQKQKYRIDVSISFMEKYNYANVLSRRGDKIITRVCTTLSARKDLTGFYYNKFWVKNLYSMADKVVVLSRFGRNDMVENYGIRRSKLVVIPNAVIPRDFNEKIPWEYGDKVILSVNRIDAVKQQGILIDALEQVINKVPTARLLLVGDDVGEYAAKIKTIIKRRNLSEYVIFTGRVDNVEYYMNNAKVLLSTSITEGFPNAVIEAMNQGLPVIATDYPGPMRDILGVRSELGNVRYGIMVPMIEECKKDAEYRQRIEQLSNKIIEILTDERLAKYYQKSSRVRARFYSKNKIEDMWKRLV